MNDDTIIERIKCIYPDALIDISGQDCSFELYIVSEDFKEIGSLQRQKAILGLFKEELKSGKLHALSVKAKTPGELNSNAGLVQIEL